MKRFMKDIITITYVTLSMLVTLGHTALQPIDWAQVPTTDTANVVTENTDIGVCPCDLTPNQCDQGCCCDPSCVDGVQNVTFDYCLPLNKPENAIYLTGLSDAQSSEYFNSKCVTLLGMYATSELSNQVYETGAICLARMNDPVIGKYFEVTPVINDDVSFLNELGSSQSNSFASTPVTNDLFSSSGYRIGTALQGTFQSGSPGILGVPTALDSNECSSGDNFIRILEPQSNTCTRPIVASACSSGSAWDVSSFIAAYSINGDPTTTGTLANWKLGTVTCPQFTSCCIDETTGNLVQCSSGTDSSPNLNAGVTIIGDTNLPSPTSSTGICMNVIQKISLNFMYTASSTDIEITQVTVDLDFTSIDLVEILPMEQSFEVTFQEESVVETYERSGNPGYIIGKPVLLGKLVENDGKSAIEFNSDPKKSLSLLAQKPDGTCTSGDTSDQASRVALTFGEDTVTGCHVTYSYDQLNNDCAAIRASIFSMQTGHTNVTHVGQFGNASYLNTGDWIEIFNTVPSELSNPASSGGNGLCLNVLTEFRIQVLMANYGSVSNPQVGIVGMRFDYGVGNLKAICDPYRCGERFTTTAPVFSFDITTVVTYTFVETQNVQSYVPPMPVLIPSLPSDLFYPLQIPV